MLPLRAARQHPIRFCRPAYHAVETGFPHAESSSAPSRRFASSAAISTSEISPEQPESTIEAAAEKGSVNGNAIGKERRAFKNNNSRAKKQALANAKKLAEAFRSEPSPTQSSHPNSATSSSPLSVSSQNSSNDAFWSNLLTTPNTISSASNPNSNPNTTSIPTIEDLLSKKPERSPPDPWHPIYPKLYKKLFDNIDSAFVLKQIRNLAIDLDIKVGTKKTSKNRIIKKILKSWDWIEPRAKPIERPPEPSVFDLPPPELFLFLRNNQLIQSLTQGEDPIEFSIVPLSQAPETTFFQPALGDKDRMVLVAMGQVAALAKLTQILADRKQTINTVEFPAQDLHGLQAPVGLLQIISNAAGAYVEPITGDKYRVTAMTLEDTETAKRLLAMAALQTNTLPPYRTVDALLPTPRHSQISPLKLSLYPWTPSLTEPLPWSLSSITNSQTLFRLKKVTEWNIKPALREIDQKNERIQFAPTVKFTKTDIDISNANVAGLRGTTQDEFQNLVMDLTAKKGKKRIKIQFGNLLFPIKPKEDDKSIGIFDNPLLGQWPIETLSKWIETRNIKPVFAPSLTPSMIQFPLSGDSIQMRRVRYRSIPTTPSGESRFVEFTHKRAQLGEKDVMWQDQLGAMLDNLEEEIKNEDGDTVIPVAKEVESSIEKAAFTGEEVSSDLEKKEASTDILGEKEGTVTGDEEPRLFKAVFGVIKESDLFIPDRPNDARLISTSTVSLPDHKIPDSITLLFEAEQASMSPLSPPSSLVIKDEKYVLEYDERLNMIEEVDEIDVAGNKLPLMRRTLKVSEEGLAGQTKPLHYTELECGSNSDGTLPPEFYRELATITRDIGPDSGALRRGNISAYIGESWDKRRV
ncbi:uncharacterized protein IL334_003987 [Kwoniella shivajii]|uniref:Mitochondrial inner-membrane-bound regulator-domain-containing protein n=1 Tax=Kwoniella shivajii TaxID=564305 RepID=A0ABZ1CZH4_9TREE|nr:hypothetical protein IL334_003987 [Kwoniella shivajii]